MSCGVHSEAQPPFRKTSLGAVNNIYRTIRKQTQSVNKNKEQGQQKHNRVSQPQVVTLMQMRHVNPLGRRSLPSPQGIHGAHEGNTEVGSGDLEFDNALQYLHFFTLYPSGAMNSTATDK